MHKISRLKKNAEFLDAIKNHNNKIIDIYKNPTISEFNNILKNSKYSSVRLFLHKNGDCYAWDGDVLHNLVAAQLPQISSPVGIEIDDTYVTIFIQNAIENPNQLYDYISKFNPNNYNAGGKRVIVSTNAYNSKDYSEYYTANYNELLNNCKNWKQEGDISE